MDAKRKTDVMRRVKSIAGHLKGVEKMLNEDAYCIDVINQIQAIQAALNKVNVQILDDHLRGCLATAVRGEDTAERERMLTEIAAVFEKSTKL
jgi:CsoR family transcriptional regulator, copper-sensing transcriptional repressor